MGPYCNKPTQNGIYEHFKTLAEEVDILQIIYNIPSRTGQNIESDTIVKLSKLEKVAGVKEDSGDLRQVMEIIDRTSDDFDVLSGDDSLILPILSLGGVGAISVASNLFPAEVYGRITKEGSPILRWILEQCIWSHLRWADDTSLTRFFHRLKKRKSKQKSALATARKLLKVICSLLREGREFRPFK